MSFQVGDTVGDYQIIGLLGAGGMGKVYKVKNLISERVDALKILLPNLAEDPELESRFTREIKVLASLNHPNIAGLRTAFRQENQLLMVMEFVEGTALDERVKAGPIPVADAIGYIQQVLAALGYAHKQGVIHRDIKPANMMLTSDNVIKLMDFGIAKSKADRKLTQTGATLGSLFYMSAEQVQGAELDGRSDLYSVGVSLYELVTGARPFKGSSDFEIMIAQIQQAPVPPIQVLPDLPKALNDIIMISLEKDPAKRFQTAEAFSAALASIVPELHATPAQAAIGTGFAGAAAAPASATGMMATPTAPPVAVGGPASGIHVSTSSRPTVIAPKPDSPGAALPPPVLPTDMPQPSGSKGKAGLFIGLGAVMIVMAVLVVAAFQVPRFLKKRANIETSAQVSTPSIPDTSGGAAATPSTPAGTTSTPSSAGTLGSSSTPAPSGTADQTGSTSGTPSASNPPVASGATTSPSSGTAPSSANRGAGATTSPKVSPRSQAGTQNLPSGGDEMVSNPQTVGGTSVAQPQAPSNPPPADKQELDELTDLHDKLAIRAQSADEGVNNLRKKMAASGNNLRRDIASSQTRMKMYMQKFDAAINAGDAAAAQKYMSLAEHEVDTLEKFLGN